MDDVLDPKKKQSFWMCTLKKILPSGDQKWQLEISYKWTFSFENQYKISL